MILGGNFKWTENPDGTVTVHNVPIFSTCIRGETKYDRAWLDAAASFAAQAAKDGHFPPMHVHHHGGSDRPQSAGAFHIKGVREMPFKGRKVPMHVADLIFTNLSVFNAVKDKRLLYRSVETDHAGKRILSLALLDSEAPFFDLPMTTVQEEPAESATNDLGGEVVASETGVPVLAFARSDSTRVLMEFQMADEVTTETTGADNTRTFDWRKAPDYTAPSKFMADESEDKDEGGDDEKMMEGETAGIDADACVKAIEDGSISLADFEAIKAAMSAREGAVEEEAPAEVEAPAETEGPAEIMQAGAADSFAALQLEVRTLKAQQAKFMQDNERGQAIDGYLAQVVAEGRISGEGFRQELEQFAAAHGTDAMKDYAAKAIAAMPPTADTSFSLGSTSEQPKEVQKYMSDPALYERAKAFAATYDPAANRVPLERALDNLFAFPGQSARFNVQEN